MRAITITHSGDADVLTPQELPSPEISKDKQVLVRVKAAGLNPIDTKIRAAMDRFPVQNPAILGCDAAGVIEAVGNKVKRFQAGDEVYFCQPPFNGRQGTYAEFCLVDETFLSPKPKSLDFVHAAAAPLVSITAWEALYDRAWLDNEQRVNHLVILEIHFHKLESKLLVHPDQQKRTDKRRRLNKIAKQAVCIDALFALAYSLSFTRFIIRSDFKSSVFIPSFSVATSSRRVCSPSMRCSVVKLRRSISSASASLLSCSCSANNCLFSCVTRTNENAEAIVNTSSTNKPTRCTNN